MIDRSLINLGDFVVSVSSILDEASPVLSQHQQRVAYISMRMGEKGNFSKEFIQRIITASLFHDIGAFSLEEKIFLKSSQEVERLEIHCIRGEKLLLNIDYPLFKDLAPLIRHHHREWYKWDGSIDDPVVLGSQILFLSDYVERSIKRNVYILHQTQDITAKVKELSKRDIHPYVADLFFEASKTEEFWLFLVSPQLGRFLAENEFLNIDVSLEEFIKISNLFRDLIDFKSRFTATHSAGVVASSYTLGELLGLSKTELKKLKLAGVLHDIGKLIIPNSILEKHGKLTPQEMAVMRSHAFYTYTTLIRVKGLEDIAEWAACHHETLTGSGYPFHLMGEDICLYARIITVADIFTALTEDRPYRKPMNIDSIRKIFENMVSKELLDRKIVGLLIENIGEIKKVVEEEQKKVREFYERVFG